MPMDRQHDEQMLHALVERAQLGDETAVSELVARCGGLAMRQALVRLGNRSLAEEVSQESLARAIDSLDQLRAPEAFIGWLSTIVARQCDRVTRGQRLVVVPLSELVEPTNTELPPDELVLRAEQALSVRNAVDRLPAAQRDAVAAYYLDDRTPAEAAAVLGVSVSTINNRLHAARTNLKRKLADMNNSPNTPATAPSSIADPAQIYEALDTTGPAGPQWRQGRLARSTFDWDTSRLATEGSDVVGLVGVYDLSMRIGTSTVRTAGFNLDYQGPDADGEVMKQLTIDTVNAAREAGYGLGVSVGVTDQLEAAGFVPTWPHLMWFVPTDALAIDDAPDTVDFEPVHREDLAALYDAEHSGLTGTVKRPTYLANKEPSGFHGRLWSDHITGPVAGYVSYAVVESWTNRLMLGPAHRGYGPLMWHDESAGDPTARLAVLAALAREHGCSEIAFDRLHPRGRLADQIRRLPHRIEHGYRHYGTAVLSLDTTIRSILDTIDDRLQRSPFAKDELNLRLAVDNDSVAIRGRAGQLEVAAATGKERDAITGDQHLAQLVVGSARPERTIADGIDTCGNGQHLAHVLFPAQEPQMDNQAL